MADIEIISSASCPFAQRTRMVLAEKGLAFRLTEISLDAKPDWFLAISPYGKVPVLRHGDVTLYESAVINEYLEEVFPEHALLPHGPAARAQARIWIDFANARFVPHVYKFMLAQDEAGQTLHRRRLLEAFAHMETEGLAKSAGPYWLGHAPSLVDLSFFPHLDRFSAIRHYRGLDVPDSCPRLIAWREMMRTRPSAIANGASAEVYIRGWRKYAENTGTGTTARDMREI
jgi:glutathione S-transferase